MSHPRIEEVSDSDENSDPSEGDIDDFNDADIMRRVDTPSQKQAAAATSRTPAAAAASTHVAHQANLPMRPAGGAGATGQGGGMLGMGMRAPTLKPAAYAGYQCLYPIYFDATRTRAEGRRVPRSLAVRNPLATEIARACGERLGLQVVFEATKTHPRDWANPGRVRFSLKQSGSTIRIENKHHLFVLVAQHLREHPTTEHSDALRSVGLHGMPPPPEDGKPWPRPAVPRGWKVGELLPHYSPALTGGGVSENFLQDMMKEMGGAAAGGGGGGGGGMPGDMASMLAAAAGGGGGPSSGGGGEEKKAKKGKGKR